MSRKDEEQKSVSAKETGTENKKVAKQGSKQADEQDSNEHKLPTQDANVAEIS